FGISIPLGAHHVVPRVRELLVEPTPLPDVVRAALANACDEIACLEANMKAVEHHRTALRQKLDRLFFREAYDREKVLMALLNRVDQTRFLRRRRPAGEPGARSGAASRTGAGLVPSRYRSFHARALVCAELRPCRNRAGSCDR